MRYVNYAGFAAIPLAFLMHYLLARGAGWEPVATFLLASLGVVPLAHMMGEATESLSARAGPTWGGLLNASFGNAAEFIIAIVALTRGLNEVVKASLTGSILGNLLLVGGAAMLIGGLRREKQRFSVEAAEANAGLLVIGVAAMLMPAIFHMTGASMQDKELASHDHSVSLGTSVILLLVYGLGLLFTLRTHQHLFSRRPESRPLAETVQPARGGVARSVMLLLAASVGIALVAELLVGSAERLAHTLGWNQVFVGVVLLAIIGNAAEHSTAILLARRDDMDTAMTIVYQSSLQIALFAVPALVMVSELMYAAGWSPASAGRLDLLFTPMEVCSVVLTVLTLVILAQNGETNWFEGVLLLALYAILAVAFFNLPGAAHP